MSEKTTAARTAPRANGGPRNRDDATTPTLAGRARWVATILALLAAGPGFAACGDDDDRASEAGSGREPRAFLQAMVPHHRSAVEMAELARERGQHPQTRQLARAIIGAQQREILQMRRIHRRLFGAPLVPDEGAHERLGLSAEAAGMSHQAGVMLEAARPFDRAFIDRMVPHHQGAIRMARALLAHGGDTEIRALARSVISAQAEEIEQMNVWRTDWYGGPSPAGGVPAVASGAGADDGGGEHEGH